MKITFEGDFGTILKEMESMLAAETGKAPPVEPKPAAAPVDAAAVENKLNEPWPAPKPAAKQEAKPPIGEKRVRTERQRANDERLRTAALAKKAAGIKPFTKAPPKDKPIVPEVLTRPIPPQAVAALGLEPDEIVRIRQQTIEDLQKAYANGHQQEVFELLSRFGNGAKSFRELPPEAFGPIRDAIDKGALT